MYLFPNIVNSQIVTIVAGGGVGGDGMPATNASIYCPESMILDKNGNIFFTEMLGHKIRKIAPNGIITTLVGMSGNGFYGDGGPANAAKINQPSGITVDNYNNIYFCDQGNNRIRKIDAVSGIISTIAGDGNAGYNGDGILATTAQLNHPYGVNVDANGDIYISDNANHRLRKVNSAGIIMTIAGNGSLGSLGDGGPATAASCSPISASFDMNGNIYFSDGASYTIRMVKTDGVIVTVAGNPGNYMYNGDNIPATIANIAPAYISVSPNGVIYVPDGYNDRIRRVNSLGMIETVAGNGTPGYSGDGGLASLSKVNNPCATALDSCGNLFFSQLDNPRIRKIEFNPTCSPIYVPVVEYETSVANIYPNPATDVLNISCKNINNITVTNLLGACVLKNNYKAKDRISINIAELPSGMYFVRVNEQHVQHFIKE